VAEEFGHEGLAETHYFVIGLALGIEIGTALAAAHGKGGEGVLEYLLETQEFQHAQVHGGVEAETALVCADGAVELDTVPLVDLDSAFVVNPRHTKQDNPFRFGDALKDTLLLVFRVALEHRRKGLQNLFYRLMELRLIGVFRYNGIQC